MLEAAQVPASYQRRLLLANFDDALPGYSKNGYLDLRDVDYIDPYGVVGLVATIVSLHLYRQVPVRVKPPELEHVASYLAEMGVNEALESFGVPPVDGIRSSRPPVSTPVATRVRVRSFASMNDGTGLSDLIFDRFDGHVSPETVVALHEATAELTANAAEHSRSTVPAILAADTFQVDGSREFIVLAVADLGQGIRSALAGRHRLDSDAAAIELALQRNVSGTSQVGRGQGLAEVAESAHGLGGWTVVRSGSARRQVGPQWNKTYQAFYRPGTMIGSLIPCRPGFGR